MRYVLVYTDTGIPVKRNDVIGTAIVAGWCHHSQSELGRDSINVWVDKSNLGPMQIQSFDPKAYGCHFREEMSFVGNPEEEQKLADEFLTDPAKLDVFGWIERQNALAMLNRVACRIGGKTEGEANAKRKPYTDLMTTGHRKLEAEVAEWVRQRKEN